MQEISRGAKINFIGTLLRLSRIALILIAAWLFGPANFGIFTLAWAIAEVLIKFSTFGLEKGLLFELAYLHRKEHETELYTKVAASLKLAFFTSLLTSFCLFLYAYGWVDIFETRFNLYLASLIIPIHTMGALLIHCSMGLKEMKHKVIIRDGVEPLLIILGLFLFYALSPLKPYGIMLAHGLGMLGSLLFSLHALGKFLDVKTLRKFLPSAKNYLALMRYSLPVYLIEIFDTILFRLDIFLVGALLGTGSVEQKSLIGVYGLARRVARVMIQTKNNFDPIFIAVTSESYRRNDWDRVWKSIRFSTEKIFLLNGALALFLAVFGREILEIFGRESRLVGSTTFLWLLAGQFSYSTFSLLSYFLVLTGRYRPFLTGYALVILLAALFGVWWIPRDGIHGAAMISGISYGLVALFGIFEVIRNHGREAWTLSWLPGRKLLK